MPLEASAENWGAPTRSRRLGELEMIYPDGQPQRPQFASGQVLTAWLHVTNACNLRCPYCYVSKAPGTDGGPGREVDGWHELNGRSANCSTWPPGWPCTLPVPAPATH